MQATLMTPAALAVRTVVVHTSDATGARARIRQASDGRRY
jgi:hypothetical protein